MNAQRTALAVLTLLVAVLLVGGVFVLPHEALAQPGNTDPSKGIVNPLKFGTLGEFVKAIVTVARDIGMLVAVLGIVYAGFLKVTARGDEEKLKKSNKAFLWAVMGTAVLLGAWLIATAIQGTVQEIEPGQPRSIAPPAYTLHNGDTYA